MSVRVILVSCVKTKRPAAAAAMELYISPLFRAMRRYAERHADVWYILSAKYGVLKPEQVVAPYELTLNKMLKKDRLEWDRRVQEDLRILIPPCARVTILAGERYRVNLVPFLCCHGLQVDVPMEGLKFGPQLRWLKEEAKSKIENRK